MRVIFFSVIGLLTLVNSAYALDSRLRAGLLKLDPQTRLEQRCDAEVLDRISRDNHGYQADRVVAYTFAKPVMKKNAIKTRGAAFRSKGQWYHLDYKCQTAPDHMKVVKFHYKIGSEIPKDEWSKYNLYP
ncbi:hypothetical protein BFN67_03305 [Pseudaminobacter manganicus]|uniref:DUF930 domain-containing protein n=1 Tax=Manganibacter manganicus TaxID=1873176 RepID=A0A1V8RS23_9HYPH|nr:DUF930 domain-containing protein [Pseudaminobacter manganicus]OQM75938.1 hypothetical protein BFN67_03305 [Pseudaminobacter manganicus]